MRLDGIGPDGYQDVRRFRVHARCWREHAHNLEGLRSCGWCRLERNGTTEKLRVSAQPLPKDVRDHGGTRWCRVFFGYKRSPDERLQAKGAEESGRRRHDLNDVVCLSDKEMSHGLRPDSNRFERRACQQLLPGLP